MKSKLLTGLLAAVLGSGAMSAQVFQAWPVQSGFNADVIANGVGSSASSTTIDVDGVSFNFVSKDFQLTSTSAPLTYGLPINGQFTSAVAATPNLPFQLADYSANNSLRLATIGQSGTMTFTTPASASRLFMLATSGSGASAVDAVVNFSDGTSQTFTAIAISDWYGGANFALQGFGRINRTNDALESGSGTNPRLYQTTLAIDAANQTKLIQSVTLTKSGTGAGISNIFGFSADAVVSCPPPTAVTSSAVTASGATVSWTAPSTVTPASYEVYYSTTNTPPTATTTPSVTGITGTTTTLSGLNSNTLYYIWVRSNCGTPGPWGSINGSFTTACSTFTIPYSENFDTTAVGSSTNTNAPNCWSYRETSGFAGYGYVTTSSPFSTPNVYYITNSTSTTGNGLLVSPATVNLMDGTKRVKFYARAGGAGYTMEIGSLSNATDASTFTAITSTPIALTTTWTQYTVNIPAGSNVNLAFRHGLGGSSRSVYLDNIIVEAIPSCSEPTAITSTAITPTSATVTWTAPTPAPSAGYEYYYSTTNTAPTGAGTATTATSVNLTSLTPQTTYYVWVRSMCGSSQSIWVSQQFTTPAAPPANDACSGATVLTPGGVFATNAQIGTTAAATTDGAAPTCQSNSVNNVYYSVVVPASGNVTIETQATTTTPALSDTVIQAYTGTCGSFTALGCDDDTSNGNFSLLSLTGLTPGSTIYVSVSSWGSSAVTQGSFMVSAYDASLGTAETAVKDNTVMIYPNPFTDAVKVSNIKDVVSVSIVETAGRVVKTIAKPQEELHLGDLKSGMYIITLKYKDGSVKSVKAIKK